MNKDILPNTVSNADEHGGDHHHIGQLNDDHWNNSYLPQESMDPVFCQEPFSDRRCEAYNEELGEQAGLVYGQRQVLIEFLVAHHEDRRKDPESQERVEPFSRQQVEEYGLTTKILTSNQNLVEELLCRMGPSQEMHRGDGILLAMAGLLANDVLSQVGVGAPLLPYRDPKDIDNEDIKPKEYASKTGEGVLKRSLESVVELKKLLESNPEIAHDNEYSLLLASEALSEALRAKSSVLEDALIGEGTKDEPTADIRTIFAESMLVMSGAALSSYKRQRQQGAPKEAPQTKISKREQIRRERLVKKMARALSLTNDARYEFLKPESEGRDLRKEVLIDMASDLEDIGQELDIGHLYELFVPLVARYEAWREGEAGSIGVYQATSRSDTPKDGIGNALGRVKATMRRTALSAARTTAQDVVIEKRDEKSGELTSVERLQLKADRDIEWYATHYDERVVTVHNSDVKAMIGFASALIDNYDPGLNSFDGLEQKVDRYPNNVHQTRKERLNLEASKVLVRDLMVSIVGALRARLEGGDAPDHEVQIGGKNIIFSADDALELLVLPKYAELLRSTGSGPDVHLGRTALDDMDPLEDRSIAVLVT
jgi:hypothetical protein